MTADRTSIRWQCKPASPYSSPTSGPPAALTMSSLSLFLALRTSFLGASSSDSSSSSTESIILVRKLVRVPCFQNPFAGLVDTVTLLTSVETSAWERGTQVRSALRATHTFWIHLAASFSENSASRLPHLHSTPHPSAACAEGTLTFSR
jgi:hypothetical protein